MDECGQYVEDYRAFNKNALDSGHLCKECINNIKFTSQLIDAAFMAWSKVILRTLGPLFKLFLYCMKQKLLSFRLEHGLERVEQSFISME